MTKIAIIGSEQSGRTALASKLGKKGNVSDVTIYDFAKSGTVLMTVDATGYPKSIKPLVTEISQQALFLRTGTRSPYLLPRSRGWKS